MVKFSMHSIYGDASPFPDRKGNDFELYCDTKVEDCKVPGRNIAMLLEPRSMIGNAYDYVAAHPDYFKAIFTHDDRLLNLTNAHLFLWCDVWCESDSEKTKGISLVSSWKNWCPLHETRLRLAKYYDNRPEVDCFGSFRGDKDTWTDAKEAHEAYKFAIVVENDIDKLWFTEKVLNCFATKTVPIYIGATDLWRFFNERGVIRANDEEDVKRIVAELDVDREYQKRLDAVNENYWRVEYFKKPWKERFFDEYEDLLERL